MEVFKVRYLKAAQLMLIWSETNISIKTKNLSMKNERDKIIPYVS